MPIARLAQPWMARHSLPEPAQLLLQAPRASLQLLIYCQGCCKVRAILAGVGVAASRMPAQHSHLGTQTSNFSGHLQLGREKFCSVGELQAASLSTVERHRGIVGDRGQGTCGIPRWAQRLCRCRCQGPLQCCVHAPLQCRWRTSTADWLTSSLTRAWFLTCLARAANFRVLAVSASEDAVGAMVGMMTADESGRQVRDHVFAILPADHVILG